MIKKLLNSDEEYFKYCEENLIGYVNKGDGVINASINNESVFVNCRHKRQLLNLNNKELEINFKPYRYPCVMVWDGDEDFYNNVWRNAIFVYQEDFK